MSQIAARVLQVLQAMFLRVLCKGSLALLTMLLGIQQGTTVYRLTHLFSVVCCAFMGVSVSCFSDFVWYVLGQECVFLQMLYLPAIAVIAHCVYSLA